jgi:gliding motility-associated-like protein
MKFCSRIIVLLSLMCLVLQAHASHIVGGEFELIHLEGNRYQLSLILYSDNINITDPAAIDPSATVHLWQKSGNERIRSVTLPKVSHTQVPYTNPDCAIAQLSTSKVIYSAEITLEAEIFNHEEGYYINYERCCRNGVINNIVRPGEVGQAFYLEFPAVTKDGTEFINSSPSIFPPLSDFARLGYPFFFDFRGTDADRDSLVYSLVAPLAGSSSPDAGNVLPPPRPAPYDRVQWATGYSESKMIPGSPPLQINSAGFIQLTPSQTGLFVFSVLVEEYREREKIGEVRRDFQLLVYDYEGSDAPPSLQAQKPGSEAFYEGEIILTDNDFPDFENNRCLTLQVSDKDVDAETEGNGYEPLQFRIRPVNFSGTSTEDYLSVSQGSVSKDQRTFNLELCLPLCPPKQDGPYVFDVIAYDDACALPLTDTLRVTVDISAGPRNQLPSTRTSLSSANVDEVNLIRELGQAIDFTVTGSDPDKDYLTLRAVGDGFSIEEYGMAFNSAEGQGPLQSQFSWDPSCSNINLQAKNAFTIFFITEDEDVCDAQSADTVTVNIGINPPPNAPPSIEIAGMENYLLEAELAPDTLLTFNLKAYDPDTRDTLHLRLDSLASNTAALNYSWKDAKGAGGELSSALNLQPDCSIFEEGLTENTFRFYFSVADDPCFTQKMDTLSLAVTLREKTISFSDLRLPNVFTPNGDGINEVFKIENLPEDVCDNRFENIQVINRWGKVLYQNTERVFEWDGGNYPAGTYYYQVNYTNMHYRSHLSLIRGDALPPGVQ